MSSGVVGEVGFGLCFGLLAGIFLALVAFALGFEFKHPTGVSVPGRGVVVPAGGLAGISGRLLSLLEENVAQSTVVERPFAIGQPGQLRRVEASAASPEPYEQPTENGGTERSLKRVGLWFWNWR